MRTSIGITICVVAGLAGALIGLAIRVHWTLGMLVFFALLALAIVGYYIFLGMVKADIFWTRVESGWEKIVLKWGKYNRTLDPGLHWVGIPGIYTLYQRKMVFFKSVTDEKGNSKAEPHPTPEEIKEGKEKISSFKTTRYPYALAFREEEDRNAMPLAGILAVFATITDYEKAFFKVSDWYAEMNTRILKVWRDIVSTISYDDDFIGPSTKKSKSLETISALLWDELNASYGGNPSIRDELRFVAGIEFESVELVSVDPPPDWRATTLDPYRAKKAKEAAKHKAEESAILLDDTNQALESWKKVHPGATLEQITEKQTELARRAYLKAGGHYQEIHGLENASTAVVGGGAGGVGIFAGDGNPKGNPKRGKDPKDMTIEERRVWWKQHFNQDPPF